MSAHIQPAMEPANPAWAFPEALQQLLAAGEEEFLAELIQVFMNQTRVRMRLLREAADSNRLDDARAQAHAIKGGSSQVGADRLAAACLAIENAAGGAASEIAVLVGHAESLFEEACRLIALPPAPVNGVAPALS